MKTAIAELGKVAFIDRLTLSNPYVGDDAAVINRRGKKLELLASGTLLEGIDFDLQYFPLKHLGYKIVTAAVSNIYAMNGVPEFLTVSLGLSRRFFVEDVEELYVGVRKGCEDYGVELVGGDTSASLTGLTLGFSCVGSVDKDKITRRSGAQVSDLVCISGSLGAAFMGLKLLEREKRALEGNEGVAPQLAGHEYLLAKQLRPVAAKAVVEAMAEAEVVPSAMIDITRGLASAALNICHRSGVGVRLLIDRMPIAQQTFKMAEELGVDPVVAALNGGDDYEVLFTVPATKHKEVLAFAEVVGYTVPVDEGARLMSPDGAELLLMSPDFTAQGEEE